MFTRALIASHRALCAHQNSVTRRAAEGSARAVCLQFKPLHYITHSVLLLTLITGSTRTVQKFVVIVAVTSLSDLCPVNYCTFLQYCICMFEILGSVMYMYMYSSVDCTVCALVMAAAIRSSRRRPARQTVQSCAVLCSTHCRVCRWQL